MTRVVYGIDFSAFRPIRIVLKVANRCKDEFLAQSILNDFYVNDHSFGADSVQDAKKKDENCTAFKNYGFELRNCASSNHETIMSLPKRLQERTDQKVFMDNNYKIEGLGVSWKRISDHVSFNSI